MRNRGLTQIQTEINTYKFDRTIYKKHNKQKSVLINMTELCEKSVVEGFLFSL